MRFWRGGRRLTSPARKVPREVARLREFILGALARKKRRRGIVTNTAYYRNGADTCETQEGRLGDVEKSTRD